MNNKTTNKRVGRFAARFATWALVLVMLMQSMALGCFAIAEDLIGLMGAGGSKGGLSLNGIGSFESDETIARLKEELNQYINKDLLQRVEDYQLKGEVGVIITFTEDSLITSYAKQKTDMTYEEYSKTAASEQIKTKLAENQNNVIAELEEKGLISQVKYNYFHALDGAFVTTTYEQIEAICNTKGVDR
ncbi:MAG: hypothetical protein IJX62_07485, partial [Clostridia bacterium]|nr:hypothetical protein [Clostridia bacterium]